MPPKKSSRFTGSSVKEKTKGRDKVVEIEDVILKQPWTLKREDVANELAEYSLECSEPLVIKKRPLISWFDKTCYFHGSTVEKRPETMERMLEVFWANDSNKFLQKCKDDASRETLKESKLELMCVLDAVLRMMVTSLLVRYIAYSPLDAFYAFLCDLFDNDIINWNTAYCLTHVKYSLDSAIVEHTYAKRWCDTYAQYRSKQWKLFIWTCYRPSHTETFAALDDLVPCFRSKRVQFLPRQSFDFRIQPHVLGVLIKTVEGKLIRAHVIRNGVKEPYNVFINLLIDYKEHLHKVAKLLKSYVESVSDASQQPQYLFQYPLLLKENPPELYLAQYATIKGFPYFSQSGDERYLLSRYPQVEDFRKASYAIIDRMNR